MVEQTNMGKRHGDTVFIASIDNMVVTNAASCLHNIFHSALMGTLYIVAKGEESVGTEGHFRVLSYPFLLFFTCQRLGLLGKELLPSAFLQHIFPLFADIRSEERRVGKECRSRWSPYH